MNDRPGGRLDSCRSEKSLWDPVASSVAPTLLARDDGSGAAPPQDGASKSQMACSDAAASGVEMQWCAVRRYGVPSCAVSFRSVPVHETARWPSMNSRNATAFRPSAMAGNLED